MLTPGKNKMVRTVEPWHMKSLEKNIERWENELDFCDPFGWSMSWSAWLKNICVVYVKLCREKKNIHICLNPILTPEEERNSVAARQGALRVDQVLFR